MMDTAAIAPVTETDSVARASDLVKALNHGVRRSALRFLLTTSPASSTEIRGGIRVPIGNSFNHHLDLLVSTGAVTREKREGHRDYFYSPTEATGQPWLRTVLALTEQED